eukprot:729277-Amphidinium_carterae.1
MPSPRLGAFDFGTGRGRPGAAGHLLNEARARGRTVFFTYPNRGSRGTWLGEAVHIAFCACPSACGVVAQPRCCVWIERERDALPLQCISNRLFWACRSALPQQSVQRGYRMLPMCSTTQGRSLLCRLLPVISGGLGMLERVRRTLGWCSS